MIPGKKTSVTLQKVTETRTNTGGISETWSDVYTFKATFAPIRAEEKRAFEKETVFSTHRVIFSKHEVPPAKRTEIKEKNRIKIGSTVYDVVAVNEYTDLGTHYELDLKLIE